MNTDEKIQSLLKKIDTLIEKCVKEKKLLRKEYNNATVQTEAILQLMYMHFNIHYTDLEKLKQELIQIKDANIHTQKRS